MAHIRVIGALVVGFFWACTQPGALATDRPNVVVIMTDDQGTLDANCFGSTDLHTPNIDRLASRGVRFTQAYAHTVCCPARAALMTGRHPQRGNVNTWMQWNMHGPDGENMNLDEVTLAEVLQQAGYRTGLFGKWHLGSHRDHGPTKQGFDEFFGIRDGFIDNYNHFFLHGEGFHDLYEGIREVVFPGRYFPELIAQRAVEFIDRNKDGNFFLYLAFNIPHYPEQHLKEHGQRYATMPMPRRTYAATITTTDYYIGQVLDRLESAGLRDDTVVIFQSDNGHSEENFQIKIDNHNSGFPKGYDYGPNKGGGNTGKWIGHKSTFFEGGIRTPAILSYPKKVPRNVVRNQVVTIMDWFPTVLELCGIDMPDLALDGRSVLPIIRSAEATSPHTVLHFQWYNRWAVRKGNWKLIATPSTVSPSKTIHSLHRLDDDRPEVRDYASERPELVERLRALHVQWEQEVAGTTR